MRDVSRADICEMLGESSQTIKQREIRLGIKGQPYTQENIDLIKSATRVIKRNSKIKIHVIDFYLNNVNNSIENISKSMELNFLFVKRIIQDYLDNDGFVFVNSKMNFRARNYKKDN